MVIKKMVKFLGLIATISLIGLACEATQSPQGGKGNLPPPPKPGCDYCSSSKCDMDCKKCCDKWGNRENGKTKCIEHCRTAGKLKN